jgi:hypothetical protein
MDPAGAPFAALIVILAECARAPAGIVSVTLPSRELTVPPVAPITFDDDPAAPTAASPAPPSAASLPGAERAPLEHALNASQHINNPQ